MVINMDKQSRIKVVACDLDGTLTNSDKHVTPYTAGVIRRMIAQGCAPVLASGRPQFGIKRVVEELNLKGLGGYIISYNGGLITEVKTGKVICERRLATDLAEAVYDFVKAIPEVHIATYQPGFIYSELPGDEYLEVEAFGCSTPVTAVDCLLDVMKEEIFKYVITGRPEVIPKVRRLIDTRFAGNISTIISEPFFLEIVPKGVNKAAALKRLLDYLGYDASRLAAFGDGRNDVEMLEYAGLSFAMANGCDEAKQAADHVALGNDEDGVARAIERYLL